jgi:hypothetical protein
MGINRLVMDTRKSSYGYEEFGMVSIGSYGY